MSKNRIDLTIMTYEEPGTPWFNEDASVGFLPIDWTTHLTFRDPLIVAKYIEHLITIKRILEKTIEAKEQIRLNAAEAEKRIKEQEQKNKDVVKLSHEIQKSLDETHEEERF